MFLRWCLKTNPHMCTHPARALAPAPPLAVRWRGPRVTLSGLGDGSPACPSGRPALPFLKKGGREVSTVPHSWTSPWAGLQRCPRTRPWDRLPRPVADFCLSLGASGCTHSLPPLPQHIPTLNGSEEGARHTQLCHGEAAEGGGRLLLWESEPLPHKRHTGSLGGGEAHSTRKTRMTQGRGGWGVGWPRATGTLSGTFLFRSRSGASRGSAPSTSFSPSFPITWWDSLGEGVV